MVRIVIVALVVACSSSTSTPRPPVVETPKPVASVTQRVIAFQNTALEVGGYPTDATIEPPLPAGLALERGRVSGTPTAANRGTLYRIKTSTRVWSLYIEIIAPATKSVYVAPSGDDANDGTLEKPLRTIRQALVGAAPGTTVYLRAGRFAEDVSVVRLAGTEDAPITIRSYPGERASIEGARVDLTWTKATEPGAAPDEFVSTQTLPAVKGENLANRGIFLGRQPFVRLLSYSRLEDLRATNEKWVLDGALPSPPQTKPPIRPWTYFGPGIWHDQDTGVVHLRLSPTHNRIAGLLDYDGPNDPSTLELGVWYRASVPLKIEKASYVAIRDLEVVGGGERSVIVSESSNVSLVHVDIRAGSEGLAVRASSRVRFLHGKIDGGVPPWTFRSDYKDNYDIVTANGGKEPNNLIRKTSRAVFAVDQGNSEIEIGYCEIENGHDNTFAGKGSELHHCRIRNIQDDALFISHTEDVENMRIHDNVIERVMTVLSGEGRRRSGERFVYRNIFDLREPVPGWRPGLKDDVWRFGLLFKGDFSSGPFYFYQNTILMNRPGDQAALALFRTLERDGVAVHPRWFVNNVVAVDSSAHDQTLGFVPADHYLAAKRDDGTPVLRSDGNVWVRTGAPRTPMFKCMTQSSTRCATREWRDLDGLRGTGFERHSRSLAAHTFVRMKSLVSSSTDDDLRPAPNARGTGVDLPASFPDTAPVAPKRDAGALSGGAAPMLIGVDGRLAY